MYGVLKTYSLLSVPSSCMPQSHSGSCTDLRISSFVAEFSQKAALLQPYSVVRLAAKTDDNEELGLCDGMCDLAVCLRTVLCTVVSTVLGTALATVSMELQPVSAMQALFDVNQPLT